MLDFTVFAYSSVGGKFEMEINIFIFPLTHIRNSENSISMCFLLVSSVVISECA